MRQNKFAAWFQRVTWIGIAANIALGIPTLLAPDRMVAFASLPPAAPLLWVRFSALLLLILSCFYMPAAYDCNRYRVVAWLAVLSRLTGVVFFSTQPAEYRVFGLFDLIFLVPEGILLTLASRSQPVTNRGHVEGRNL
jgi:hypothetical protein